jgi:4a-hydroxytetrahydrobiopterin dehydratase
MVNLSEMKCVACRGGEPTLTEQEIYRLMPQVPEWRVKEVDGEKRLERVFKFKNFAEALAFTDRVGAAAEAEDHHPLLITEWGKVTVNWWTHVIHGLHQNDFVMAARTDQLL